MLYSVGHNGQGLLGEREGKPFAADKQQVIFYKLYLTYHGLCYTRCDRELTLDNSDTV